MTQSSRSEAVPKKARWSSARSMRGVEALEQLGGRRGSSRLRRRRPSPALPRLSAQGGRGVSHRVPRDFWRTASGIWSATSYAVGGHEDRGSQTEASSRRTPWPTRACCARARQLTQPDAMRVVVPSRTGEAMAKSAGRARHHLAQQRALNTGEESPVAGWLSDKSRDFADPWPCPSNASPGRASSSTSVSLGWMSLAGSCRGARRETLGRARPPRAGVDGDGAAWRPGHCRNDDRGVVNDCVGEAHHRCRRGGVAASPRPWSAIREGRRRLPCGKEIPWDVEGGKAPVRTSGMPTRVA
jgi:hypothetical protein